MSSRGNKIDLMWKNFYGETLFNSQKSVMQKHPSLDGVSDAVAMLRSIKCTGIAVCTDGNDLDGMAGAAIWRHTLNALDIKHSIFAPTRDEGYGMNMRMVDIIAEREYNIIVTNDNGIRCFDAIARAVDLGITVIVTDHHQPEFIDGKIHLPNAACIINPHLSGPLNDALLTRNICGAYVSYILCRELLRALEVDRQDLNDNILELAAIATISDVMPLIHYNRMIVKTLYERIEARQLRNIGLHTLFDTLEFYKGFSNETIAIYVVPLFNACSRMTGSCDISIKLLTSSNIDIIKKCIYRLKELNDERKQLTTKHYTKMVAKATTMTSDVLYFEDNTIKAGICGILAARLSEKTGKPVFVFSGEYGSGRSHGADILKITDDNSESFKRHGGHKNACGCTLQDGVDGEKLFTNIKLDEEERKIVATKHIDYPLDVSLQEMFNHMRVIGPFGQGFPIPLFRARVSVNRIIYMKRAHTKLLGTFTHLKDSETIAFVIFNELIDNNIIELTIDFHLSVNYWNERTSYQCIIKEYFDCKCAPKTHSE